MKIIAANSFSPCEDRQRDERSCDRRRETRGEIIFAEDFVAGDLCPVGEGRLVQAQLVVEMRHDIIAALDHFPGGFGKTWFVAIDQRHAPGADRVKKKAAQKEHAVID